MKNKKQKSLNFNKPNLDEKKEIIKRLRDEAIKGYEKVKKDFESLEKGYLAFIDDSKKMDLRKRNKSAVEHKIIFAKVRKIASDIMKT